MTTFRSWGPSRTRKVWSSLQPQSRKLQCKTLLIQGRRLFLFSFGIGNLFQQGFSVLFTLRFYSYTASERSTGGSPTHSHGQNSNMPELCASEHRPILSTGWHEDSEASEDNSERAYLFSETQKQISEREQLALNKVFRRKVSSTKHWHGRADSLMGLLVQLWDAWVYYWKSNERDALLTNNMTQQYG